MKKLFVLLSLLLLITACATQQPKRPANDSNYEADFRYPQQTTHFVLQEKVIFPQPHYGVMLRYVDKRMYDDLISIYVYPIARISWDDLDETLNDELIKVLGEVDQAITIGIYSDRSEVVRSNFVFTQQAREFVGKKARMKLTHKSGAVLDSAVYLFLAEDKFIKFRTSFDASYTPDWSGDAIVQELLPGITPPPESEYMRNLRKKREDEITDELTRALLEALNSEKEE